LGEFLQRIRDAGDASLAWAPGVTAVAAELASSLEEDRAWDVPARHLLGWLKWYQALALPAEQQRSAAEEALDILAPAAIAIGFLEFPHSLLPALADCAAPGLTGLLQHAEAHPDAGLLSDVVDAWTHLVNATPEEHPDRAQRLSILGGGLLIRFQRTGTPQDLEDALAVLRRAVRLGVGDRGAGMYLSNLCAALKLSYERTRAIADLDEAVAAGRRAVTATEGHEGLPAALANLSGVLQTRFDRTSQREDLDEAIAVARRAVTDASATDPNRAAMLNNLVTALHARFKHTASEADLDEAVSLGRLAVDVGVGRPDADMRLKNLGDVLESRLERTSSAADLDDLIWVLGQRARLMADADPLDETLLLTRLGQALLDRYQKTETMADLDEIVAAARRVVEIAIPDNPGRIANLLILDWALEGRYEHYEALGDLDELVTVRQWIVGATRLGDAERSRRMSSLGGALLIRFARRNTADDLDEAVAAMRDAVSAAGEGPERLYCLSDLCSALQRRFANGRMRADLDEAATVAREAVAAGAAESATRTDVLINLARALSDRARATGSLRDLDDAIRLRRCAADATDPGRAHQRAAADQRRSHEFPHIGFRLAHHGDVPDTIHIGTAGDPGHADVLDLLGRDLEQRFEWTGVQADADEAVRVRREAVAATIDDAERADRLAALSHALTLRELRSGNLDKAVAIGREAVALAPDHVTHLVALSDTLQLRSRARGIGADLDEAVEIGRRAAALGPPSGWERAHAFANLSNLLLARFELHGDRADIDGAVEAGRQALASSGDQVVRPEWLVVLAQALETRIGDPARLSPREEADRAEALRIVSELAGSELAAPRLRVHGARIGARLSASTDQTLAADLLETAVRLLPEVAPRRMRPDEQRRAIESVGYLADHAAAVVLSDATQPAGERAQRALSLLEAGRGVLLGQILDVRSDLAELRRAHPELAARFTALRDLLDHDGDAMPAATTPPEDRIETAARLAETLREIRAQDGFDAFALPPTVDELLAAASHGPVVTFNVAHRGDALLLTSEGVDALPLPALTGQAVVDQVNAFHLAVFQAHNPDADRVAAQAALSNVLRWLWDNGVGPVLDKLGYHDAPPDGVPLPRVWWAPGGYLSLLPLHAAGHHDDPVSGKTVMDRVVSSYTPTVRALWHARQRQAARTAAASRSLIVAMPTTPGLPRQGLLRNVAAEAALLAELLPDPLTLVEPRPGAAPTERPVPTRDRVFSELPSRHVAHFACHGDNRVDDPGASRLLLHDHETNPLTVDSLSAVNLDGAQLAYLSACHTALHPAERLLGESVHLATAFQVAGFPQVVGTLWELDDEIAVEIAADFYSWLRDPRTGTLDLSRAARALHRAIRIQRDLLRDTPSLWAAHLHAGA
jgi:tetratricopeptide (TPR) repeat protein